MASDKIRSTGNVNSLSKASVLYLKFGCFNIGGIFFLETVVFVE